MMLDFADLDMMARGAAITLLLLGSWLLYRDYRTEFMVRMTLLMNTGFCCHILSNIPQQTQPLGLGFFLLELGDAATPGLFWLFVRAWFNDEDQIGWRSWLLIAASVTLDAFTLVIPESEQLAYFLFDECFKLLSAEIRQGLTVDKEGGGALHLQCRERCNIFGNDFFDGRRIHIGFRTRDIHASGGQRLPKLVHIGRIMACP